MRSRLVALLYCLSLFNPARPPALANDFDLFTSVILTRNAYRAEIDFQLLKKIIEDNKVKSIERLLPLLPTTLRNSYVVMYESKSLQEASFQEPRIILNGPTGKFIVSFNGNALQQGGLSLEILQWNENDAEFEFRFIRFPEDSQDPVEFSQKNPARCKNCHGDPLRPIWETYNVWPGAYGADHSFLNNVTVPEIDEWKKFLAKAPNHPRYKHLYRLNQQFIEKEKKPNDPNVPEIWVGPGPEILHFQLVFLNHRRIARQIFLSSAYLQHREAIVSALTNCPEPIEDFLTPAERSTWPVRYADLENDMETVRNTQFEYIRNRIFYANRYYDPVVFNFFIRPTLVAKLRYILANSGIDLENWSSSLEARAYAPVLGLGAGLPDVVAFNRNYRGGFTDQDQWASEIYFALKALDPSLVDLPCDQLLQRKL